MIPTAPLQSVFARDPSLAFIFFISFTLMAALGVRFALYAYWNLAATELEAQRTLWQYMLLVGLTAALYGALGVVEAATAVTGSGAVVTTPFRDGVLLGFILVLAVTMRRIHSDSALSNADPTRKDQYSPRRTVDLTFVALVTTSLFGGGVFGTSDLVTLIEGGSAVVLGGYGLLFGRRQLTRSTVRGTMIDSLLRHLLPVLTFAVLVLVVDLTVLLGLSVAVARHIQVVFVIMTATALMTSTIKLRQNVTALT